MGLRTYAGTTGLLGGIAWVIRYFVAQDAVWWAGLALLALGCLAAGAGLVNSSAPAALRLFTAAAVPVLVASVWWVIRDSAGDVELVDAALGAAAALAGAITLAKPTGMAGNHS